MLRQAQRERLLSKVGAAPLPVRPELVEGRTGEGPLRRAEEPFLINRHPRFVLTFQEGAGNIERFKALA